jgi:hypothetical protein
MAELNAQDWDSPAILGVFASSEANTLARHWKPGNVF